MRKWLAAIGLSGALLLAVVAPVSASNTQHVGFRHGGRQCVGLSFQIRHHLIYSTAEVAYNDPTPAHEAALHATLDRVNACGLLNLYVKYFRDNEAAEQAYVEAKIDEWYG